MLRRIRSPRGSLLVASVLALACLVSASAAQALPPECPLLLPDFRCGRHGRYDGFVPPMMDPYLFEDPFITTGLSAWGIYHQFPGDSTLRGGDLWAAAIQARIAITDRIAFIATKDGWIDFQPGLGALDHDAHGYANLGLGLKVAAIDLPKVPFILTPSLRFELTQGSRDVLQGNGEGIFIPALSAAWGWERFHTIGSIGAQVPINTDKNSTSLFYYLHFDYALFRYLVPFAELGGFHYVDGGNGSTQVKLDGGTEIPIGVAQTLLDVSHKEGGLDYTNVGSKSLAGRDVVIGSVGLRVPVTQHLILGGAWEYPLTHARDVLKQRATLNVTVEF
jgi:hypothetical protein